MFHRLRSVLVRSRAAPAEQVHYLQMEPTTRCNFTCGFCIGRAMDQSDLPLDLFKKVLDTFPELQHLQLQGEGEPLMHQRFFDMVRAARAAGARVSFITNGSWFTTENVQAILGAGIHKILVSLESADADTFQQIRGGKLAKVTRGVRSLLTARAAAHPGSTGTGPGGPSVGLALTILQRTRAHLPGVIALYEALGLDGGICPQPLQKMATYAEHYDADMRAQMLSEPEIDLLKLGRKLNLGWQRLARRRSAARSFHEELFLGWRRGRHDCPWLDKGLFINRKGQVSACCTMEDMRQHSFGTIGQTSRRQLLAAREALRTAMKQGVVPKPCQGCEVARLAHMTRLDTLRSLLRSTWGMVRHLLAPVTAPASPPAPAPTASPVGAVHLHVVR